MWNEWLRDTLPDTFVRLFQPVLCSDPVLRYLWIRYLPAVSTGKEIGEPFFRPLVDQLYSKMAQIPCLLSTSDAWKRPNQLLIAGSEADLGFGDVLCDMTQLEFIHGTTQAGLYSEQMKKLGAAHFLPDHLLACLNAELWLHQQDDAWFNKLFGYLQTQSQQSFGGDVWRTQAFYEELSKKVPPH